MAGGFGRGSSDSGHRTRDLRAGPFQRARAAWAPGWPRTVALRRCAAAVLAVTAVLLALRGDPASDEVDVVVAAQDLPPGSEVTAEGVTVVRRAARSVPRGALSAAEAALGRTIAAPVRAGEVLTDVRLLGEPLAQAAAGVHNARLVTIRLADPALADVVRAGDLVDIIAAPADDQERAPTTAPGVDRAPGVDYDDGDSAGAADAGPVDAADSAARIAPPGPDGSPADGSPLTMATAAPVVLVPPAPESRSRRGRILLVALPAPEAARVASASMTRAMTVTMH
ncbi:SAF domain-containing protein [Tomitella fengzijianii]|uniref:Flagellar biosynthesis protein FlgA n=1 Tax=Tomitella fengzijianii TaxID=2597660 RepID=A0A516X1S1_9ACTN|nr:SAF domain-containing protein [Tomitella fengzijianii]QDQ97034.1 flagellar biosynthesis protein FlgA [Tomitella fengzijianii]